LFDGKGQRIQSKQATEMTTWTGDELQKIATAENWSLHHFAPIAACRAACERNVGAIEAIL
jgi:hypothetical protein